MQIMIEEVVSRIRAIEGGSSLSAETLRTIVSAVLDAVDQKKTHTDRVDEEHSLRNYQQRNQPWSN